LKLQPQVGRSRHKWLTPLEPSAKESGTAQPTPNRAPFELAQGWPRCEGGRQYVNVASWHPAVDYLSGRAAIK